MSKALSTLNRIKKPAPRDWHRADIIAAIRKTGTTLQQMARDYGYSSGGTLRNALNYPAPKYERLIAEQLGISPQVIWPSRYHADGSPKSGRGERGRGRYKAKFNASSSRRNANLKGAN